MNEEAHLSSSASLPSVSVIMPCYNSAAYIGEAIDSVLSQDYPNIELIVVDDGSTDNTAAVVKSYLPQLILLQQHNQGAAVARNQGIAAAKGDYIAFLDADDLWLPGKISTQIRHFEQYPEVGIVFSRWQVWKPEADGHFALPKLPIPQPAENNIKIVAERSGWLYNRLLMGSLLHTITVVARRELIDKVGPFDTSLKRGQDYDYWLRASRHAPIHQLNHIFALYRVHGQGCITKWPRLNYEEMVVQKALDTWGLVGPQGEQSNQTAVAQRLARTCFSFGYYHYHQGDIDIAYQAFCRALHYHWLQPTVWRYALLSWIKRQRKTVAA